MDLAVLSTGNLPRLVAYSSVCHGGFIVGCIDGTIHYISTDSSKPLVTIASPKRITSLGFVELHDLLLVAVSDLSLYIYHVDVNSVQPSASLLLTLSDHHVNWINSIDSLDSRFLTSGQDKNCRVWCIKPKSDDTTTAVSELVVANRTITLGDRKYTIDTEALLMGHEDMVLSGRFLDRHHIITSSADRTIIKWAEAEEAWQSILQVGDVTGIGTAGNGDLYDVDVLFESDCNSDIGGDGVVIVAHNTNGTIVSWREPSLQPVVLASGHLNEVTDLVFDRANGDYLLTCSLDRTTRAWRTQPDSVLELGRPQIHGYDLKSIDFIDAFQFVSAADEKVLRIFNMTDSFAHLLRVVGGHDYCGAEQLAKGAVMQPALGLSNKASASASVAKAIGDGMPTESELSHSTLWPETDKLYGHGDELQCVACSLDGKWMASASRATLAGDSSIRLWSTETHQTTHILKPHHLTVVRLSFSPCSRWLLSCSRDRKIAIGSVADGVCVAQVEDAHERIVWDGAWISGSVLVTGSRDQAVKVWRFDQKSLELCDTIVFEGAVTALCTFSSSVFVGLESGHVFHIPDYTKPTARQLLYKANGRINRLSYSQNRLALAGSDHAVVIIPHLDGTFIHL